MVKKLPILDFRAIRKVLELKDYGLAPKSEPKPTDLVSKKTWNSIVVLPDSVAVETSNHYGTELSALNKICTVWVESVDTEKLASGSGIQEAFLNVYDEFQAFFLICYTGTTDNPPVVCEVF